jgi:hypothetical protein
VGKKIIMTISEERKKRVIDLYYNQGKTTREIAKIERMSIRDISIILKEEEARRQKYKDRQQQEERSSKAYDLFSKGKRPIEVAVTLNLGQPEVTKLYREYWKLKRLHKLYYVYTELGDEGIGAFLKLYRLMKEKGMSIEQVANAVYAAIHKLPYIENLYEQVKEQVQKMQSTRQGLANDIRALEYKISVLDKTAFSCEQERMRTEQRVQGLTDEKDKLEKLIANILNGEGYSKLKQIVKENVKVVLSENRKLISISFAALIQTIKTDPQMVKVIQNIPGANDGEQHKDNDNSIAQYLEFNKNSILNLAEKNYQNLLEVLANNTLNAAAASNPISSLRQPSTFANLSNQIDTYKIEEPDTHHNSNGNIVE